MSKQVSGCSFDIWCVIVCAYVHTCVYVSMYANMQIAFRQGPGASMIFSRESTVRLPSTVHCLQRLVKAATLEWSDFTIQQPSMNMSVIVSHGRLTRQRHGALVRRSPASGCQNLIYLLYKLPLWILQLIFLIFRSVCVCVCALAYVYAVLSMCMKDRGQPCMSYHRKPPPFSEREVLDPLIH